MIRRWYANRRVQTQILLASVLILVVGILSVLVMSALSAADRITKEVHETQDQMAARYANRIKYELEDMLLPIILLTENTGTLMGAGLLDQVQLEARLKNILSQGTTLKKIGAVLETDAGPVRVYFEQDDAGGVKSIAGPDNWQQAIDRVKQENVAVASQPYPIGMSGFQDMTGREAPIMGFTYGRPVLVSGAVKGVLLVEINMEFAQEIVSSLEVPPKSFANFASSSGTLVAVTKRLHVGKTVMDINENLRAVMDIVASGKNDQVEFEVVSSETGLVVTFRSSAAPVQFGGIQEYWGFAVGIPELIIKIGAISVLKTSALVGLLVIVGGLIFVVFVARSIGKPIVQLTDVVTEVSDGNTDVRVPLISLRNELGGMARAIEVFRKNVAKVAKLEEEQKQAEIRAEQNKKAAMETMASRLEKDMNGVIQGMTVVAQKFMQSSQGVSAATQETGLQVEKAEAGIQVANQNIQTVAGASGELATSITQISGQVAQSAQDAQAALQRAEGASETVAELETAAAKIGSVVELIENVAQQTNLLALNATVEAARAGDAGKGFSVVANEVKNLANQTATAIEEIRDQVEAIQAHSTDTVRVIKDVGQFIREMTQSAQGIAAAIEQQTAATEEISRSVNGAAESTEQVSASMHDVSRTADNSSEAAQVIGESTQTVVGEIEKLRNTLYAFLDNLREDNGLK